MVCYDIALHDRRVVTDLSYSADYESLGIERVLQRREIRVFCFYYLFDRMYLFTEKYIVRTANL